MNRGELLAGLKALPGELLDQLLVGFRVPTDALSASDPSARAQALFDFCCCGQVLDGFQQLEREYGKIKPPEKVLVGAALPALDACFSRDQAGDWVVTVYKRGLRLDAWTWNPPEPSSRSGSLLPWRISSAPTAAGPALFRALLGDDPDWRLHPWRLRIRAEASSDSSRGPRLPDVSSSDSSRGPRLPDVPFWKLALPEDGASLIDAGWTVCEQPGQALQGLTNGRVLVLDDPDLKQRLRPWLGPDVYSLEGMAVLAGKIQPPSHALWVVGPGVTLDAEGQQSLQQCAAHYKCPLLIWCGHRPVSRASIGEVVCVRDTPLEPKRLVRWLARLLTWLKDPRGLPPEQAIAQASRATHDLSGAFWLRGAFDSWKVSTPTVERPDEFLHDWYRRIDRVHQEAALREYLKPLLQPESLQRVLVVGVPGEVRSGLIHFRDRPLELPESVKRLARYPRWGQSGTDQRHLLFLMEGAGDATRFVEGLTLRAGTGQLLLMVLHDPIVLCGPSPGDESFASDEALEVAEPILLQDLKAYLQALEHLAEELAGGRNVRIYVHIPVVGQTKKSLEALLTGPANSPVGTPALSGLPVTKRRFRSCVLHELKAPVPLEELQSWAEVRGLALSDEELEDLSKRPYEEILEILESRLHGVRRQ